MFCKMIAKDFKKLEGKWTYKVFMVGGSVFYEAPCNITQDRYEGFFDTKSRKICYSLLYFK